MSSAETASVSQRSQTHAPTAIAVTKRGRPMRTVTAGSSRSASRSYPGCRPSGSTLPSTAFPH